jgi:hypothetical protein
LSNNNEKSYSIILPKNFGTEPAQSSLQLRGGTLKRTWGLWEKRKRKEKDMEPEAGQ